MTSNYIRRILNNLIKCIIFRVLLLESDSDDSFDDSHYDAVYSIDHYATQNRRRNKFNGNLSTEHDGTISINGMDTEVFDQATHQYENQTRDHITHEEDQDAKHEYYNVRKSTIEQASEDVPSGRETPR